MTTHTTPIDLRPYHGRDVKAVIGDYMLTTEIGRFSVSKSGSVFFCNNSRGSGLNLEDIEKFGCSRFWIVQCSTDRVWDSTQLKSITILDEPKSINPEWDWKDGEEVECDEIYHEVCLIHPKIIALINKQTNCAYGPYTLEEAYKVGIRKLPPPPSRKLVEITEEIFRSTAWYGKKILYDEKEYTVSAVDYEIGSINYAHWKYSQCKLIEE